MTFFRTSPSSLCLPFAAHQAEGDLMLVQDVNHQGALTNLVISGKPAICSHMPSEVPPVFREVSNGVAADAVGVKIPISFRKWQLADNISSSTRKKGRKAKKSEKSEESEEKRRKAKKNEK